MTIQEAADAYSSARDRMTAERAKLQGLVDTLAADTKAFSTGAVRVRADTVICAEAMNIQNLRQNQVNSDQDAVDAQSLVVSQATVDKDKAKLDLQNAVRDSDITDAVEAVP